jgi:hypothetical protein
VLWKGFPAYEKTWEPVANLENAAAAVAHYHSTMPYPRTL